jgi:DNA processing protein
MDLNNDKKFFVAFNYLLNFTFKKYKLLIQNFKTLERAFYSSAKDLIRAGLKPELVFDFVAKRKKINLDEILEKIKEEKIKILVISDKDYPFLLANIYSPPPILYYKGNINIDWNNSLSVVGSRKFTYYGEKIIKDFIPKLTRAGLSIISGLAIGIDSLAHQAVLDNNGKTIAVLGSGLDYWSIYPRANRKMVEEILQKEGLVLSEFPLGTEPISFNFPQRNRIIAGLSRAVLVAEAGEKSGSLITAKYALEEGREVLSLPGSIYDDNFCGNNNLIKSGAGVVLNVDNILDFFNVLPFSNNRVSERVYQGENDLEREILAFLKNKPLHIDEFSSVLPYNFSEISSSLAVLEIKGIVRDIGGKNYELA